MISILGDEKVGSVFVGWCALLGKVDEYKSSSF
jgi:hypothetical protein